VKLTQKQIENLEEILTLRETMSIAKMSAKFGISRATISGGMSFLIQLGVIQRRNNNGYSFGSVRHILAHREEFAEFLRQKQISGDA
jgi:predicted transcriptional regulator